MSEQQDNQAQGLHLSAEQVAAVNMMIQGVLVAQRKGAYSLQDASLLKDALEKLVPPQQQDEQPSEDAVGSD